MWKPILKAGSLAGILDISAAFIQAYVTNKVPPGTLLRYIASGLFGSEAFSGGVGYVIVGLVVHFLIAFSCACIYFLVYPKIKFLSTSVLISAFLVALVAWIVTTRLIIPLSQIQPAPFDAGRAILAITILYFCIGLPITFIAKAYYAHKQPDHYVKSRQMPMLFKSNYRKETLSEWELESLTNKFSDFSFFEKSFWLKIGYILIFLSPVIILLPSRYGNWTPPASIEEYKDRLLEFLILTPVLIVFVSIFINIRNKIDLYAGYKWTANFRIIKILSGLNARILLLNNWMPFRIRVQEKHDNRYYEGQIITIKRTATFRVIDYYIHNKDHYVQSR